MTISINTPIVYLMDRREVISYLEPLYIIKDSDSTQWLRDILLDCVEEGEIEL